MLLASTAKGHVCALIIALRSFGFANGCHWIRGCCVVGCRLAGVLCWYGVVEVLVMVGDGFGSILQIQIHLRSILDMRCVCLAVCMIFCLCDFLSV